MFLFAAGFGMLLFFSTSNTVLETIVPDEMRGRVMGVWSLVFGAMIPLGSLEAGVVAHWVGTPLALAFGAIICAVSAAVTLSVIQRREAQLKSDLAGQAQRLPSSRQAERWPYNSKRDHIDDPT